MRKSDEIPIYAFLFVLTMIVTEVLAKLMQIKAIAPYIEWGVPILIVVVFAVSAYGKIKQYGKKY